MEIMYDIIEGEEWNPILINGESTYYDISSKGRVRSSYGKKLRVKSPSDNGHGYLRIGLSLRDIEHSRKIHRLVALAFIPNPHNLPEVCHKDHNKYNNAKDNLEWGTKSYNGKEAGKYGKLSRGARKLPSIPIGKFFANICLKSYPSIGKVTKDGYPRISVTRNLNKDKSYRGFHWKTI